jgi:hypothetical protein
MVSAADVRDEVIEALRREVRDLALRECIEIADHYGHSPSDTPDRAAFRGMVASLIVEGINALREAK